VRLNRVLKRDRNIVKEGLPIIRRVEELVLRPLRRMLTGNMVLDVVVAKGANPSLNIGRRFTLGAHLLLVTKGDAEPALETVDLVAIRCLRGHSQAKPIIIGLDVLT